MRSNNLAMRDGAAVEAANAHSAYEIAQLRQTAQALRENIEGLRHEHREEIQRLIADAQGVKRSSSARPQASCENASRDSRSRAQALKQEALKPWPPEGEIRELRRHARACVMNSTACAGPRDDGDREIPAEVPATPSRWRATLCGQTGEASAPDREDVEVLPGVAQRISGTESLDEIMEALVGLTSLATQLRAL